MKFGSEKRLILTVSGAEVPITNDINRKRNVAHHFRAQRSPMKKHVSL